MDTRACHFARGKQARDRGPSVQIGFDAAHQVVRRPDRQQIARQRSKPALRHVAAIIGNRRRTSSASMCRKFRKIGPEVRCDSSTMLRETMSRGARNRPTGGSAS